MRLNDVLFTLAMLVVVGGIAAFFLLSPEADRVEYKPTEITGSQAEVVEVDEDGESITVSAEIKQSGFITINQAIGEAPGPLVATSELLEPGSHTDIVIKPDEPLLPGEYFILMFVDNENDEYDPRVDLPVMSDGQVIKKAFSL